MAATYCQVIENVSFKSTKTSDKHIFRFSLIVKVLKSMIYCEAALSYRFLP